MNEPNPPGHLLQHIANNPSVTDFQNSFAPLRDIVKGYLRDAGHPFERFTSILDFGCGVGRFIFAFRQELAAHQKLHGCDVYEPCANWCQQNIDFCAVKKTQIDPPLPYENGQFDLVYALSVYTHLRLDMQFRWAWEIHRILRPGGVLFATFHGPVFMPVFYETHRANARVGEFYSFGDDGLFAYLNFRNKKEDEGQVDVASAHNISFFRQQFSGFDILRRVPQSRLAGGQDLYIIRKPDHGRSIERPARNTPGECTSWSQQFGIEKVPAPVTLPFKLAGHKTFRVYPTVSPAGMYGVTGHVLIKAGGQVLAQSSARVNNERMFGGTHYAVIEVPVPEHQGPVTVELAPSLHGHGTLSRSDTPTITWAFPHFT